MFVTNDGVTLHVRETGTGTPVLLLHGWPDDGDLWPSRRRPSPRPGTA